MSDKNDYFYPNPLRFVGYIFIGLTSCLLLLFSVIEVKKYVFHFRNLRNDTYHSHRLTYDQVLNDKSRQKIIENILKTPNIQYNELRKNCNLHPGQFRWHTGILLNYGIIKKQKIGQYVIFFPVNTSHIEDLDFMLKFPLRDNIFKTIQNQPGITISGIARILNMQYQRNTVKYHVDKLIRANYIATVQKGREKELYSCI
ncbi:MAG: winged helix-turn-helix transcriptional regulator [Promethearchaeota archaeon]